MTQDIRICFVGDSLVNGTGDRTTLGWAGRLCAAANASGTAVTYYNLGIRGNTSKDILLRWESECALRLPPTCDGRVVFSFGVNDTMIEKGGVGASTEGVRPSTEGVRVSLDESCANLRQILGGAKKFPVIMVGPPPVDDDEQNARIQATSIAYSRATKSLGIAFIELYSPLVSDRAYRMEISRADGAHPTSDGYAKIADIVRASSSWWWCNTSSRRHQDAGANE